MKKALCLLLSIILALGCLSLPAQAAGSSALQELLDTLRGGTPAPEETPAPEKTPAPQEEQEPPVTEDGTETQQTDLADSSFATGYISIPAGTAAYKTAALTSRAGVFAAESTAYALSAGGDVLEAAFVNAANKAVTVVYVNRRDVSPLSDSMAAALRTTLTLRKAPVYEGFPLPTVSLAAPEAPAEETQTPADEMPEANEKADTAWKAAPTNVQAVLSADGTKAVITWTGNSACTGYAVYEQLASGYKVMGTVTGADKTTYTTKALEDGTHTFYVRPRNGSQVGYASETVSVTVGGAAPTPTPGPNAWKTAPTNVKAVLSADGTKAVITWTGNAYCTGYAVYEQLESSYKVLGTVTGADNTTFTTKALEDGEHIFYVKAKNGSQVGYASETVSVTIGGATPTPAPTATPGPNAWKTAPTNVQAVLSADGTKAVLSWKGNDACTGYAIYEQLASGYKVMGTVTGATKTTYTTKALEDGEHVFYVKPRNGSQVGYASETVSVTVGGATPTPAPTATPNDWRTAPTNLTAALSSDGTKAVLSWTGNEYCTGYAIYEQLESGYKVLGTVTGADKTTYTTKALEDGEHVFFVKPRNNSAVGHASENVSVTIGGATPTPAPTATPDPNAWKTAPANLTAVLSPDETKAVLSWTGNESCTGYAVYEQLTSGYKVMGTLTGPDKTTYTTKALEPGEHIFYVKTRKNSAVGYASETVSLTIPGDISGTWGNLSWTLDKAGTLTISGTGAMNAFESGQSTEAWHACKADVTRIVIEDGVTTVGDEAFCSFANVQSVSIPRSVTRLGNSAFNSCTGLTELEIPDSVTSIGNYALFMCTGLTRLVIPGSVKSIGEGGIQACANLAEVTLNNGLQSIGNWAFEHADSLTALTMPDTVTSIGQAVFSNCGNLSSVTLSNELTVLTSAAFLNCSSLSAIRIPDSVTFIGDSVFQGCSSLTSIVIPDSVTAIDAYAFAQCPNLTSVTLPAALPAIPEGLFWEDFALPAVTVPTGVTSIGVAAFGDCQALRNITLPNTLETVSDHAFYSCDNLTDIHFNGTQAEWSAVTIGSQSNDALRAATVHYTQAATRRYYALTVGEKSYPDGELKGTDTDAQAMAAMLSGLNEAYQTTVRIDRGASQLLSDIAAAFAPATDNDVCLFYYSGHGAASDYAPYVGALSTVDDDFITLQELADELNKVKGHVIVILDSCHSGAAIADKSTDDPLRLFTQSAVNIFSGYRMNPTALDISDKSSELATGKFTVMAAAAYSETSTSLIYDDIAFGAFTYALMDGMGCDYPSGTYGGSMPADSDRADGRITLNEIFTYVLRYTKDWDLSQTAQRYGDGARVLFSR